MVPRQVFGYKNEREEELSYELDTVEYPWVRMQCLGQGCLCIKLEFLLF